MSATLCSVCHGKRLRPESLAVKLAGLSIADFTALSLSAARPAVDKILRISPRAKSEIAARPLEEVAERIDFLLAVGLGYLSLDRSAATLSGGEAQRIRLATQIGSRLRGVLYVLDEPSIGLHARDNDRLLGSLEQLRDLGNTVLVVEHDEDTIRRADFVVDLGPGAGNAGGYLVAKASRSKSPPPRIAHRPISQRRRPNRRSRKAPQPQRESHPDSRRERQQSEECRRHASARLAYRSHRRLRLGQIHARQRHSLSRARAKALSLHGAARAHRELLGADQIDKVIEIDQAPIGRTPRSNPATYTGVFAPIRDLFAMLPESRERGYRPGRFSFNVKGGRCEACQGDGLRRIEMNFLPDVYVMCEVCRGRRYNSETLAVRYKGHSITDILNLPISEALKVLENIPQIQQKLSTLVEVGLGYVKLGQSATTLSGGEAQRIKLARELSKRQTGRTLYILDEPTTGLHFDDVRKLLDVLQRLVALGNTVLIIEHHLDVIKQADWIIDLGPEGGEGGGRIVAQGPPEHVARTKKSYTGQALARVLGISNNGHHNGTINCKVIGEFAFVPPSEGTPILLSYLVAMSLVLGNVPSAYELECPRLHEHLFHSATYLGALRTYPLASRKSKVTVRDFAKPAAQYIAHKISRFASQLSCRKRSSAFTRRNSRRAETTQSHLWGIGGHVIKVGLGPVLIDLMKRGFISGIAMNGAALVHDFEIALAGNTSEDVDAGLGEGEFGMAAKPGNTSTNLQSSRIACALVTAKLRGNFSPAAS